MERYVAADGAGKKFDMVDGAEYDGDKACECLSDSAFCGFRISCKGGWHIPLMNCGRFV